MPSFCVAANCEYKYTHLDNVSFHKFPLHLPQLLAKWIKFTERGPNWKPSRWSSICSRHFLPNDFRDVCKRKCLKKDAIPSVTMTQFNGSFLNLSRVEAAEIGDERPVDGNCRLCGLLCRSVGTYSTNFEVFGMIQKCFPTLNIGLHDKLPKHLCAACLQRLQNFSNFVDEVLRTQKDLEDKFITENVHLKNVTSEKQFKIKQEPVVKVKQEVSETNFNLLNAAFDGELFEDEPEQEQKSQFFDLPTINSQDVINNCDIMEIISLDDAFIDIPDDEAGGEQPMVEDSKENLGHQHSYEISEEHNYYNRSNNAYPKQEKPDEVESVNKTVENHKPNLDIVVIEESIMTPLSTFHFFKCQICEMQFMTGNDLSTHEKLTHGTKYNYICFICNSGFTSIHEQLRHKLEFHLHKPGKLFRSNKIFMSCPFCGKFFSNKLALNNHQKYICDYQKGQKSFPCKYCGTGLPKWLQMRQHERKCPKQMLNIDLNKGIATKMRQKQPKILPNESGIFVCPTCDRTFTRAYNLLRHLRKHRPLREWNFKCGDCGRLFDHLHDLRRHSRNIECPKVSQKVDQLFFVCTMCGKQLKTLQKLQLHSTIHSGKKPYVCESCGKSFGCFNNLYQHRITHTDVKRYKCDLCEKVFKRRGGLNQHNKATHLKLKPHECPICRHRYALKGDMSRCRHSDLKLSNKI